VAAARDDFGDLNRHLVTDPRVRVVADDGRNYLASRREAFDVVVGDLLVPWRPTESALYTKEHFESVRRALLPEGIFCQWLPLYQLSRAQLAILMRTFLEVFPRTTVWRGNFLPEEPTLALVGHRDRQPLDAAGIDQRLRVLAPAIDERNPFLKDPAGVWLHLIGSPNLGDPELTGARLNRDDEPWVELLSLRGERGFVGAGLTGFLERLSRSPLEGGPLEGLDAAHRAWRAEGMALARASLVPGADGEEGVLRILLTLPDDLQRSLGVGRELPR
jgi:spermidine synthase